MLKRLHTPARSVFLLVIALLLNFSVASVAAPVKTKVSTTGSKIAKAEMAEGKGILEPVIELVNGSQVVQQNIFHLKKNSSSYTCSSAAMALLHYAAGACTYHLHHTRIIPLYLANRSILI